MSVSYRVVFFSPDPARPLRLPVAALLQEGERVRLISPSELPATAELGSVPSAATLQMILFRLSTDPDFLRMPPTVGPHAYLAPPRQVPEGVVDPAAWILHHLLPGRSSSRRTRGPQVPSRQDWGWRYLQAFGLAAHVARRFRPADHLDACVTESLRAQFGDVDSADVSFYCTAKQDREFLLIESLAPGHPGFESDLNQVADRFRAYDRARHVPSWSYQVQHQPTKAHVYIGVAPGESERAAEQPKTPSPAHSFSLIAFILPSERRGFRARARDELGGIADYVIDTIEPAQRRQLAQMIRATSLQPGSSQGVA